MANKDIPCAPPSSEMGPLLLSRMLDLNDTQEGVLNIVFRVADEQGLLLLDLKDLRAVLGFVADNASDVQTKYGNVAPATIGAIQRQLLVLENQGGDKFLGEPALDLQDFIAKEEATGRGYVNILAADKLMRAPRLYATFLLWMLTELFAHLPEVGDLDTPKLVFFFDEAHLLFTDAPKNLLTADRAGRASHPLQGRRRLFRHAESARRAGHGAGPARQPHPARAARLHAARPEGGAGGGGDLSSEQGFRHGRGDHAAWGRRSAGVDARRQGDARNGRPRADRAAERAGRDDHGGGTPGGDREQPALWALRHANGPRIGVRGAAKARRRAHGERRREARDAAASDDDARGAPAPEATPKEASADGGILGKIGGMVGGLFTRTNPKRMSAGELAARAALQSAARSIGTQISREVMRNIFGGMSR